MAIRQRVSAVLNGIIPPSKREQLYDNAYTFAVGQPILAVSYLSKSSHPITSKTKS